MTKEVLRSRKELTIMEEQSGRVGDEVNSKTGRRQSHHAVIIRKRKRVLLMALMAVGLFTLSMAATLGIYSWFNPDTDLLAWMHKSQTTEEGEVVPLLKERFNLLILGVDERLDDLGRSDTMLFFSVPSDGSKPLLISIPRDTMIWKKDIQDYDRINNIYPTDGIDATVQTVRNLFGVPIDGYIKVNIEGFVELVDIMGGVRITVDEAMDYDDPYQDLYIHIQPGEQILDGQTAMEYVRFRADGMGDIGRIERQQKFLKAALNQALSLNNITRIPNMVRQGFSMVETNISLNKLLSLANTVIRNGLTDFESVTLPGDGLYYGDASVYMLNIQEMYELIAEKMIPEEQDPMYLKLLQQKWIVDYMQIHETALTRAQEIWEATGMWLSESEYQAWLTSLTPPEPEPDPNENPGESGETLEEPSPTEPLEPPSTEEPQTPTPITLPTPITP